jgi:short-subunit dehydrogenase
MATEQRGLAVVTGGSRGIGLELARQCASNGFDVALVADSAAVDAACDALDTTTAARVHAIRADLTTYEGVEKACAEIKALGRPIEALLLNAGVGVGGDFIETDLEEELRMIQLNCSAVVHIAKRLVPDMVQRRRGKILVTSSVAAIMPSPRLSVYGATKAFDLGFAEGLRGELRGTGVTVTALQPGPTETAFFRRAKITHTKVGQKAKDDPALVARQGFAAMMAGKHKTYAGSLKNRLMGLAAELMPEPWKARQHERMLEPA